MVLHQADQINQQQSLRGLTDTLFLLVTFEDNKVLVSCLEILTLSQLKDFISFIPHYIKVQ